MSRRSEQKKARRKKRRAVRDEGWIPKHVLEQLDIASDLEAFDAQLTDRGWEFSEDVDDETGAAWYWPASEADVADEDEVDARPGEHPQQPRGGSGELVGVVDDDDPHTRAHPLARLGVVLEQLGRGREDPGGVEGPRPRQCRHLVVLTGDLGGGDPLGAAVLAPDGREWTPANIGAALATRNLMTDLRSAGLETRGPKPFGAKDRSAFLSALDRVLGRITRGAQR